MHTVVAGNGIRRRRHGAVALLVAAIVLLAAAAQQTAAGVSWVTVEAEGNSTVLYGRAMDKTLDLAAEGTVTRYTYYNDTSGYIHHCTLDQQDSNLDHGTKYYYAMGSATRCGRSGSRRRRSRVRTCRCVWDSSAT